MYISSKYIDVKSSQDYSEFDVDKKILVICDGIGEFKDSGIVSKRLVKSLITNKRENPYKIKNKRPKISIIKRKMKRSSDLFIKDLLKTNKPLQEILEDNYEENKKEGIVGGTTLILAEIIDDKSIGIKYLGNGGIIHLCGDYASNPTSDFPYRYAEIMLPDINPDTALNKHLSHGSGDKELEFSSIKLDLNNMYGDILFFYTDGVSSLEDKYILKDGDSRYWRVESNNIQYILREFDLFLRNVEENNIESELVNFNTTILKKMKQNGCFEDDASLGIIFTKRVIEYYKKCKR